MKRSTINGCIRDAIALLERHRFLLPPFAYFSPAQWQEQGAQVREVADVGLGWDLTDHGTNDFDRHGLLLFTIRNGRANDPRYPKTYAEKILVIHPGQVVPMHFHFLKMEDIINRGGGVLAVKLYRSSAAEGLADTPIVVSIDGFSRTVPAGGVVRLQPGESISLPQRLYHSFWAEGETVLAGEVSMVNDDRGDNRFYEKVGRFPVIEEDVAAEYLLCTEYGRLANPSEALK